MNDTIKVNDNIKVAAIYSLTLMLALLSPLASADNNLKALTNTCVVCHGVNGISTSPIWPNLAGQKAGYLAAEMRAFRDGTRQDPLMSPTMRNLSDQQIDALATYYSELPARVVNTETVNEEGKNVRAYCVSCHGVQGITVNEEWPNLAGQQKAYLEKQLMDFRNDRRTGPIMQVIAKELSEAQIKAVAEYYSQQSGR